MNKVCTSDSVELAPVVHGVVQPARDDLFKRPTYEPSKERKAPLRPGSQDAFKIKSREFNK